MADDKKFDLAEAVHNMFLAGVGAVAITADKSKDVIDKLVAQGELTVKQGKALNEELAKKAAGATKEATAEAIKAQLKTMDVEDRAKFVEEVRLMADQIAKEAAETADKGDDAVSTVDPATIDAIESDGGVVDAKGTDDAVSAAEIDAHESN